MFEFDKNEIHGLASLHRTLNMHRQVSFDTCICYLPAGRSVLEETVAEVLSAALGRKAEGTFSSNMDRPGPVNNTFIFFLLRFKSFRKILLQPPTYVCWSTARSCWCFSRDRLQTKTKHDNMILTYSLYYHN